ncbi:MAG: TMEM175 family protein [Ignavibacteriota bacterium]
MNKTRLEAFSDGVLAIIITIMVLELKMPHDTSWEAIKSVFPSFGSYVLSFIFIGIYWGNHHHLLHATNRVTAKMIWANLALLFCLSLVPPFTAWMADTNFDPVPVAIYGALLCACGVAFTILAQIVVASRPSDKEEIIKAFRRSQTKGKISTAAYLLAIPLAFVNPMISCFLFIATSFMWIIPDRDVENFVVQRNQAKND